MVTLIICVIAFGISTLILFTDDGDIHVEALLYLMGSVLLIIAVLQLRRAVEMTNIAVPHNKIVIAHLVI